MPEALLSEPTAIAAYLVAVVGLVFWLSGVAPLRKVFQVTPPVLYAYFLPMLSTFAGITPAASPAYAWITRYLLPFALLLLMISVDLRAIARLGRIALIMMVAGTAGVALGAIGSYVLFGGVLPPEAWKGFAALTGSWIGGTANFVAIAESVGTPPGTLAPFIVVDTVVGYGWMGVLLALSAWQHRFDRAIGADTSAIEETNRRLAAMSDIRRPTAVRDVLMLVAVGLSGAVIAVMIGDGLPALGSPPIISGTTWAVLLVVTVGLLLSFTPMRRLEEVGASSIGYGALYLLLAAIGARADLRAIADTPLYLVAGAVWIIIHIAVLFGVARLVRAPLFFVATGSMANIGGAASAPIVAGVYHPAMAPVGLLMAVAGYILGIYAGFGTAWVLGQLGT
jgi:uncharacterized membrane protein